MIERRTILYKFNSNNQNTVVVKCTLEKAYELFQEEYLKMESQTSAYTYIDITVNDRLLRSWKA